MLDLEFGELSDRGSVREGNEDYLGHVVPGNPAQARTHGWLFALADGVGGQALGEVASRAAVEALLAGFRSVPADEPLSALLPRLVQEANHRVLEAATVGGREGTGMATTLVACALRYDTAVIAHVGDSRCYLVRDNQAMALTRDHTLVNEQIRLRVLSDREAAEAPGRHILSRSLGAGLFVNVETDVRVLLSGDILVLCSDGLHGSVPPADIVAVVRHYPDLNAAARELVALANQRDGSDNISVQLIRILDVEHVGMYRGRPYKLS
ncbi:MAG TPA: protein phosphatase 2C domain-containing protein [Terriglobia bacterium]|nr:protein phosphatase 2C domain-containing protein [Terriglobia bacterium]